MCAVWSVRFFLKFITEPIGISIHIIGTDAHRLKSVFWPIACSFLRSVQSVWNIKITVYFFIKKIGLLGPVLSIKKNYQYTTCSRFQEKCTNFSHKRLTCSYINQNIHLICFLRKKKSLFNRTLWNISIVTLFSSLVTKNTNTFKKLKQTLCFGGATDSQSISTLQLPRNKIIIIINS